jgi:HEAT repeat protein
MAFDALRGAAASPELDSRRAALVGLGLSGRKEALLVLAPHARSEDEATRLIALSALANLDGVQSLLALSHAARDPAEPVRTAAIGLLAQLGTIDATRILCGLLREPAARELARAALGTRNPQRVAGIFSILQQADDELALELSRSLARLDQPDATAALFEALTLGNASARKAAATTLGAIGSRDAFTALQRLARSDSDPEVRRISALLLAQ